MKISKKWAFGLLALLAFSCRGAGTDIQPIVIDLSAARTPAPSASPTPAATASPAPPRPAAAPAPAPTVLRPDEASASARLESSSRQTPEEVAQSRIEAYNRRELEALIGLYAPDARFYEPPDRLRDSGIEQIRQTYARRFASAPRGKITVAQRMTEDHFVVDREIETGGTGQPESALVISEILDGKIVRVWILR
jgi:hypothetical protein